MPPRRYSSDGPNVRMEKISVITPVLNRRSFIAGAIESVREQIGDGFELEHIVVDGGSTDGTLEVLAGYPHLRTVSGKDRGVYDALNKGIGMAEGTIVGLLNSDDVFLPGTLEAVARAFATGDSVEMVCLSARLATADANGAWRETHRFSAAEFANPGRPVLLAGPILTNSRFYRPDVLRRIGLFDLDYRLISDRKLLLDLFASGKRFTPVEHMALEYRGHAGSLTFNQNPQVLLKGIWEKLDLAEHLLAEESLSPGARSDYRAWHRHEVLMGLILAAQCRSPSAAVRLLGRGFRGSLLWPITILPEAGRLVRRRFARSPTIG